MLFTLELTPAEASVESVCELLKLAPGELDQDFGVVPIDPEKSLYSILVDENAIGRLEQPPVAVQGPYSNPRIATLGPRD